MNHYLKILSMLLLALPMLIVGCAVEEDENTTETPVITPLLNKIVTQYDGQDFKVNDVTYNVTVTGDANQAGKNSPSESKPLTITNSTASDAVITFTGFDTASATGENLITIKPIVDDIEVALTNGTYTLASGKTLTATASYYPSTVTGSVKTGGTISYKYIGSTDTNIAINFYGVSSNGITATLDTGAGSVQTDVARVIGYYNAGSTLTKESTLTITNYTGSEIAAGSLQLETGINQRSTFTLSPAANATALKNGESATFTLTYTPTSTESLTNGIINIYNGSSQTSVTFYYQAKSPDITYTSTATSLTTEVGKSVSQDYLVYNNTGSDISASQISAQLENGISAKIAGVNYSTVSSPFSIVALDTSGTILKDSFALFSLVYTPTSETTSADTDKITFSYENTALGIKISTSVSVTAVATPSTSVTPDSGTTGTGVTATYNSIAITNGQTIALALDPLNTNNSTIDTSLTTGTSYVFNITNNTSSDTYIYFDGFSNTDMTLLMAGNVLTVLYTGGVSLTTSPVTVPAGSNMQFQVQYSMPISSTSKTTSATIKFNSNGGTTGTTDTIINVTGEYKL